MSLEYLEFLGHLFSRFFIAQRVPCINPRTSWVRGQSGGSSRPPMQGIGHCDLLTERECKGNHKIPFLLSNFATCYFLAIISLILLSLKQNCCPVMAYATMIGIPLPNCSQKHFRIALFLRSFSIISFPLHFTLYTLYTLRSLLAVLLSRFPSRDSPHLYTLHSTLYLPLNCCFAPASIV